MAVDYALILSAGFGTRMGDIGKNLPKVLWPVFEKSLLSLQVAYLRKYGAKKIFINTHFMKDELLKHVQNCEEFHDVEFLVEESILGIGGGIHNLARKVGYTGTLMINNADQFIFLDQKVIDSAIEEAKENRAVLFAYEIDTADKYSLIETDENEYMKKIINKDDVGDIEKGITYTGLGIINLEGLAEAEGNSNFFSTVADYKNEKVRISNIDNAKYWDFGTLRRYFNSCFEILSKNAETDLFYKFLISEGAIKESKINDTRTGYNCDDSVLNLGSGDVVGSNSIVIEGSPNVAIENGIYYREIVEKNIS